MKLTALILANLTPEDEQRFHAAGIIYSGSTGQGAKPEAYHGLAPYIATYSSELTKATEAMGWIRFSVEASEHQVIARCESRTGNAVSRIRAEMAHLARALEAKAEELADALRCQPK
jgi:hypothetical protein